MLTVQSVNLGGNSHPAFRCRLPRNFSAMMDYIYKKTPVDMFESPNLMRVETKLDDGREISGIVTFANGKFKGLTMYVGIECDNRTDIQTTLMCAAYD